MKRAVVVAIVAAVAATSGSAATSRPTISLADRQPVTILLRGFRPHELVKVMLLDDTFVSKRVLTSMSGRALARFPNQSRGGCEDVHAAASGNKGSTAKLLPFQPGCPPVAP